MLAAVIALATIGCTDSRGDGSPSPASTSAALFQEGGCVVPPPEGQRPENVRCGSVNVPENRSSDNGREVRLAVMVLRATGPDRAPDPIVYLSGGPGVSALRNDLASFGNWLDLPLQRRRDIVVFDLRGTGSSEPSLDCPEERNGHAERLAERLGIDQEYDATEANALACRERLVSEGIDLAAYDSAANAADVRDVMKALGYAAWNIYAFSYGTRVAWSALDRGDDAVRSVVLDSPSAPAEAGARAAEFEAVVLAVFASCAEDAACAGAYPDLVGTLDRVLATLDDTPVSIRAQDGTTVLMTAERFVAAIFRQFNIDFVARMPADLYAIARGDSAALQPYADMLAAGWSGISSGVLISAACRERVLPALPSEADQNAEGVRRAFVDGERLFGAIWPVSIVGGGERFARAQRFCEAWGAPALEEPEPASLDTGVPVLVLSGQFDAGEPPSHGQAIASGLRNSRYLVVPNSAHGQGFHYPLCAGSIAAAFYDAPADAPDADCLSAVPPIAWELP